MNIARRAAFLACGVCLAASAGAAPVVFQLATATSSDVVSRDYFGAAAAISGDTTLLGAFNKSSDTGAAYVFTRDVAGWSQQTRLAPSDAAEDDDFGITVGLSGDTAVVGADSKNHAHGAAYVFTRDAGAWSQQAKLVPGDTASGDYFGAALAVSGDTVVVGAFNKEAARGAAYVFVRESGTWTQQAKLVADDGDENHAFGVSVALDGDTAVVGAYGPNGGAGGAYVYSRVGTTWTLTDRLAAADGESGDYFGGATAVRGDVIAIGAFAHDFGKGGAYVFTKNTLGAWAFVSKLSASDGVGRDYFGTSIALDGETVVVGADYRDGAKGGAYVFKHVGATWLEAARLFADDAEIGDHLGYAVAANGGTVVAGAYGRNNFRGSAYWFGSVPTPTPPPPPPVGGGGGGGGGTQPPKPGITAAEPMQLSLGASILVTGIGFSTRPRVWLDLNGRKLPLRVQRGAQGGRFSAKLASIPRNLNGECKLNVLPRGSKTPFVLEGMSIELPAIDAATAESSEPNASATITGAFFGTRRGQVRLGGRLCRVRAWHDTSISVRVPKNLLPGLPVDVEVDNLVGGAINLGAFTR